MEAALELLLGEGRPVTSEAVKAIVMTPARTEVPALSLAPVDLGSYDALLAGVGT